MADFDFDELDKAVTGALGSTPDTSTSPSGEANTTVPTPTQDTGAPPTVSSEAVRDGGAERTTLQPPASRRSAGRFMDMVHPASDMRSSRPVAPRPAEGEAPAWSSAAARPEAPEEPVPFATNDNDLATPDTPKPLESPFLPDAKVEKRPLGGAGMASSDATDTSLFSGQPNDTLDGLLLEEPEEPKIEAQTTPDPIEFAALNEPPKTAEVSGVTETTTPEGMVPEIPVVQADTEQPAYTGQSSISQQYEEAPSSSPASGAIYDTEAYHQPLPQPAKKKSGVLVVLWILVLIAVGAGAGAAFYLYVLPLL